jgi:hypothetical protein
MFCGKLEMAAGDVEAVRAKVERHSRPLASGCVVWTRSIDAYGYGQFWVSNWRGERDIVKAHRAAYELAKGPIPEGLTIDHVCENKACLNPAHLEPVPATVNSQRYGARRSTCKKGHPKLAGRSRCQECSRDLDRNRYADPEYRRRKLDAERQRYARNPEPKKAAAREYYRRHQWDS